MVNKYIKIENYDKEDKYPMIMIMRMNIQAPAPGEKKDYEAVELKDKDAA